MIIVRWLINQQWFSTYWAPLYCLNVLEIWACSVFALANFPRRKSFPWLLPLAIVANLSIAIGLGYLRALSPDSITLRMVCTLMLYLTHFGVMFLFFDEKPAGLIMAFISILAIREIADGVETLIKIMTVGTRMTDEIIPGAHWAINAGINDIIHLAVQLPLSWLFAKGMPEENDKKVVIRCFSLSFFIYVTTVVTKTFMVAHSEESIVLYTMTVVLMTLLCIFILIMRTETIRGSLRDKDLAIMNAVLESEQKQFEESKQSIQLVNARVHDIKHRLDEFGDKVAADTLEQLKSSVSIYDRQFHTGSQVLDTVLYSKSLQCDSMSIRLSAICDGRALHYIPSSKRYYLFSNILDNAIEATMPIEDQEKRIIGLCVKREGDKVLIDSYNYFKGERTINNGLMETSKSDNAHHGLGLKSISYFVNEYKGEIRLRVEEDMFFLSISLPAKDHQAKNI